MFCIFYINCYVKEHNNLHKGTSKSSWQMEVKQVYFDPKNSRIYIYKEPLKVSWKICILKKLCVGIKNFATK